MYQSSNIGALIKAVPGVAPAAQSAGAVNGAAIDRLGYLSCVLAVITGAVTGTPSAQSSTCQIEHSDDGLSNWGALTGAQVAVTGANSIGQVDVDLSGAKRYIRVVNTTAFTGGTTPTLASGATVVLGGADKLPA